MITRDKIRGMFLGVAIGDAFGMPLESKKYEDVKNLKRTNSYRKSNRGKPGSWTDDTQLTIATALAMLESGDFNMDDIAAWHVKAYKASTSGWGGTTRDAVKKLSEGCHWSESGNFEGQNNRGFGNGVVMKLAPLAAYFALANNDVNYDNSICDFTMMTHQTSVAVSSCYAHIDALIYCLQETIDSFRSREFIERVIDASEIGAAYFPETFKDNITTKLESIKQIYNIPDLLFDDSYLVSEFGGGSCYVYDSLPFSYAFFLRGPFSIESMYDVAYAGGDADTNASIVASMIGAICGTKVFPKTLVEGLSGKNQILRIADLFYEKFFTT